MTLAQLLRAVTPRCFRRAAASKERLNAAVKHNEEVVEDATREIRMARSRLTRAVIVADMRAIDDFVDRRSDQ